MATPFETFVNNEIPTTLRAVIPLSGNLPAGRAMVSTGVGLNTEPKLVQTQDPLLVRYVGTQPGDYADLKLAIESLPVGVADISTQDNPYRIYVRQSMDDQPSGIVNSANNLIIEGVNDISSAAITISFKVDSNDYCIKTTHGTTTNQYLHITNIELCVLANSTSANPILSTDFAILDFDDISNNTYLYMSSYAKLSASAASGYHPVDGRVSLITCSNTAATNKYVLVYFASFGATSYTLSVADGYGAILSCQDSFLGRTTIQWPGDNSSFVQMAATVGAGKEHKLIHVRSLVAGELILRLVNVQLQLSLSSTAGCICKFMFLDTPSAIINNVVFTSFMLRLQNSINSSIQKLYLIGNRYNKPMKVGFYNCSDTRIGFKSVGAKAQIVDAGYLTANETGSFLPEVDMSQVGHLDETTQQAVSAYKMSNIVVPRVACKTTQSPLAPAAPQAGDLWIETTEQY